jgi:acetyl esterase/lipase
MGKYINFTIILFSCLWLTSTTIAFGQDLFGQKHLTPDMPDNLTAFIAQSEKPTPVVLVCPGGSYSWLDWETEGIGVARWLQSEGITAFVLRYRVQGVASFVTHYRLLFRGHQYPDALEDANTALRYIQKNAKVLNIDPDKIGMMGFSAGGHLTAQVAQKAKESNVKLSFAVPVYPVVTMINEPYVHKRSRRALLGEWRKQKQKWRKEMSLELHTHSEMPPVFLVNCIDDPIVHYHNSELLDSALTASGVVHEYHQYKTGGHGFGADSTKAGQEAIQWKAAFIEWMKAL